MAVSVVKIKTWLFYLKETLTKLKDKVTNAQTTMVVDDTGVYNNILVIDDAVGSGATLNEIAKKDSSKRYL